LIVDGLFVNGLRVVGLVRGELKVEVVPELGGLIWSINYGGKELLYHHRDLNPLRILGRV